MASVLIVYHSVTGGTRLMAEAAYTAARTHTNVLLKDAIETTPEDLLAADGYIFACPENLAAISGLMKDFFDRCYYPLLGQIEGRPYGQMICAGSDGENAVRQIQRIVTGWRLREVHAPFIVCTHAQTPDAILAEKTISTEDLEPCRTLGAEIGAGLAAGIF